jgi:hypothetical protein
MRFGRSWSPSRREKPTSALGHLDGSLPVLVRTGRRALLQRPVLPGHAPHRTFRAHPWLPPARVMSSKYTSYPLWTGLIRAPLANSIIGIHAGRGQEPARAPRATGVNPGPRLTRSEPLPRPSFEVQSPTPLPGLWIFDGLSEVPAQPRRRVEPDDSTLRAGPIASCSHHTFVHRQGRPVSGGCRTLEGRRVRD